MMPTNKIHPAPYQPSPQTGFSLIEILVGLAIGLLATLVIVQVFSLFEGQKRTTTGTADAQTNGSIALYNIQRDIQMAGFGLPIFDTQNPPLNCDPSPTIDQDGNATTPEIGMFPISIIDGGATAGASDSIAIRYGLTTTGGIPVRILDAASATTTGVGVDNHIGCQNGDIALISNGATCALKKVTGLPDTTHIVLNDGTSVTQNASISCLGNWNEYLYTVNGKYLLMNSAPSVANIVNIQAQYGISATSDSNKVTEWVDATDAWAAPTVADRKRIKAIRIAVVARNDLLEKTDVTVACSSTTDPNPTGLCAWEGSTASPAPAINLADDWQRYRYRVFETIVPLRNMIWSSGLL